VQLAGILRDGHTLVFLPQLSEFWFLRLSQGYVIDFSEEAPQRRPPPQTVGPSRELW